MAPPASLTRGPVHLRRWRPDDLPALESAVRESWEHLRPWMSWAQGERDQQSQRSWLLGAVEQWDTGEAFQFALLPVEADTLVGSMGLMRRIGAGGLELGYWVHVDHVGRGLVTNAAAALTEAALRLPGVEHVEIHCDAANTASAAVPLRLGYQLVETRDVPPAAPRETGRQQVWRRGREPGTRDPGSSCGPDTPRGQDEASPR